MRLPALAPLARSLHIAFSSVALGQCPAAVNAGVNLLLTSNTTGGLPERGPATGPSAQCSGSGDRGTHVVHSRPPTLHFLPAAMTQKAGMLALDGRCKTLSPAADGYARADACGVMLLLPPAAAGAPLALVAGTAVNQDGRSSSLTAPNGPSQQEVVRAALGAARIDPAAVIGLQMHGTGERWGRQGDALTMRWPALACRAAWHPFSHIPSSASRPSYRHIAGRPHRGGRPRGCPGGPPPRWRPAPGADGCQVVERPRRAWRR